MKLAEALIVRADQRKRIEQLKQRLMNNAKVQEGEKPSEEPEALLREIEGIAQEHVLLIQRINKTNSQTEIEPGVSLADAIATRDILLIRTCMYRELAQAATATNDYRLSRSEVKYLSTVEVSKIQKIADQISQQHRELEIKIQEKNWKTELI